MEVTQEKRKNVIWIFGDQHRGQALGINGDPNVNTPNIDNLALSGLNFSNAVSGTPLCCPARGTMLTSIYPHKCVPGHEHRLPESQPTIAHVFNEAGYETAYFGKWHLDGYPEAEGRAAMHIVPPERRGGFQKWVGYENNNSQWDSWVHGGEGKDAFHERLLGYETDALTDLFINYIDERACKRDCGEEKPFFAVLSVQPPHDPYLAPAEFRKNTSFSQISFRQNVPQVDRVLEQAKKELPGYYAMIENLDWNIGRILQTLRDQDLYADTHIIFFSDHGDMLGSHGQFRKLTPHEEAIRIPMIISGEEPFYYRGSGDLPTLISLVDLAPTTLGLCGIEVPEWMEGTDYSTYRLIGRGPKDEPDSAYLQSVIPTGHGDSVDKPWRGIVTKDGWKYVCFEEMPWLMFNLNEDPYEQVNLAHNPLFAEKRRELKDRLQRWIEETDDRFLLP